MLLKSEALALRVVIRGVEHLADNSCHSILLDCLKIVSVIEFLHIKSGSLSRPQTQYADSFAVFTGDKKIVGDSFDGCVILELYVMVMSIPEIFYPTLKSNLLSALRTLNKPCFAAGEPEIGQLCLPAVNNLLLEDAVFVKDRVTHTVVALCCKAVKVARGKSAETAVAETCIRLTVVKLFELDSE